MKKKFTTTIDEDVIKQAKNSSHRRKYKRGRTYRKITKGIPWNGISRSFFYFPKNSFSISAVEALFVSSPAISINSARPFGVKPS